METNVANKKKENAKVKKESSARQEKKEVMQRNASAAVEALARYRKKTA